MVHSVNFAKMPSKKVYQKGVAKKCTKKKENCHYCLRQPQPKKKSICLPFSPLFKLALTFSIDNIGPRTFYLNILASSNFMKNEGRHFLFLLETSSVFPPSQMYTKDWVSHQRLET